MPPGDYEVSFDDLRASMLANGPDDRRAAWDVAWRVHLIGNLEILTRQLGKPESEKSLPTDFECSLEAIRTGELTRQLNLLDPFKVWTWDPAARRAYRGYPKKQLPMWHRYRIELYPQIQGSVLAAASATDSGMNWRFLPHSVSRAGTGSTGGS